MSFLSGLVGLFTGKSLASTLVRTATTALIMYQISKNAIKKNDAGDANIDRGVRLQIDPGANNKIPVLYGTAFFGGIITDAQMTNNNKTMYYCLTLCERTGTKSSDGLATNYVFKDIYWNDQRIVFLSDAITVDYTVDRAGTIDRSLSGLVKVYCYAGGSALGATPDGYPATPAPAAHTVMPTWGQTTHLMSDLIFAIVKVDYNRERNVTGLGNMMFEVESNMRQPGDVLSDYMTNTRYGAGIAAADISSFAALNTYALQSVAYDDQGTGAQTLADRYQINGLLDTAQPVMENIEKVCSAAGSWLSYDIHEGKWGVVINRAGTSIASFDDSNILGNISLSGTGLQDLYNAVKVEFPHRELRDSADFVTIEIPDADRNSNEEDNTLNISYDIINEPVQAQLLGFIELKQSRVDLVIKFSTDFGKINLKAGDIIDVTNQRFSFTDKLFRIITITEIQDDDGSLMMEITALEYDADVYSTADLYRYTRTDSNGIITIGSVGSPGTPQVVKYELDSRPRVIISSTAPTGIVEGMEFWITNDVALDEANRSYRLIATQRPVGGGVFTSGTTVTLDYDSMPAGSFLVKTRGFNTTTVGTYSAVSGLSTYNPTQVTDAIGPDTSALNSTGGLLTALALVELLGKLDGLFGGDSSKSLFDKIFSVFEQETGVDLVGQAAGGDLVVASSLGIADEGTLLTSTASTINFVGDGVTVDIAGTDVVVNITGGTGGGGGTSTPSTGLAVVGSPTNGQTIAWNGSSWVPVDSCCVVPIPEPTKNPDLVCYVSIGAKYPPDSGTYNDSYLDQASGAETVPITGSYYLVVGEEVYGNLSVGTGNAKLYKSNGTLVQTISAAQLTINNNVVGFPFSTRELGTDYYILVDQGMFKNGQCVNPAYSDPTSWNFNTPAYSSTAYNPTPTTNTPGAKPPFQLTTINYKSRFGSTSKVDRHGEIELVFNRPAYFGQYGTITINGSQSFDVTTNFADDKTSEIIWTNGNSVFLNPTTDLSPGGTYSITGTAISVRDIDNVTWSGITGGYSFTVDAGPSAPTPSLPATGSVNQAPLALQFDRAIVASTGNINVYDGAGNLIKTISSTDPAVSYT